MANQIDRFQLHRGSKIEEGHSKIESALLRLLNSHSPTAYFVTTIIFEEVKFGVENRIV